MKVKYIGEISHPLELINGKVYERLGEEGPFIGLLMKLMRIICIRKRNLLLLKIKYIGETDF